MRRIAYRVAMLLAHDRTGSGPGLVLVHGITESRRMWDPLIPPLSEQFDVLAVDLRGHGESPTGDAYDPISLATDVAETVAEAGIVAPLVVGHSLGGVVVSAYAAVARPRAVVNVDQPLRLAAFKEGLSQLEPMLRGDQASFDTAIDLLFTSMNGPLPEAEVARVKALRRADQQGHRVRVDPCGTRRDGRRTRRRDHHAVPVVARHRPRRGIPALAQRARAHGDRGGVARPGPLPAARPTRTTSPTS